MAGKPCRYKECKGRVHRGPCPVAARIAKKRRKHVHTNEHMKAIALRKQTQLRELNLCGFCFAPAADCANGCTKAAAAQEASTQTALKAAGRRMRAKAAAAAADRLKAMQLIETVPTHPVAALGSMRLTCIKCNHTGPATSFKVAFAASDRFNLGDGLCCIDIDEVV